MKTIDYHIVDTSGYIVETGRTRDPSSRMDLFPGHTLYAHTPYIPAVMSEGDPGDLTAEPPIPPTPPVELEPEVPEGPAVYGTPATHYYDAGVLTERPDNPAAINRTQIAADGVDTATVSSIPMGTVARITGPSTIWAGVISDGTLELTATFEGQYEIYLESSPERDTAMALEAIPA